MSAKVERHRAALGDLLRLPQGRAGRRAVVAADRSDGTSAQRWSRPLGRWSSRSRVAEAAVDGGGDERQIELLGCAAAGAPMNRPNQPHSSQRQLIRAQYPGKDS